jgi:hypothetical protein
LKNLSPVGAAAWRKVILLEVSNLTEVILIADRDPHALSVIADWTADEP